jgi:hypothetical protein
MTTLVRELKSVAPDWRTAAGLVSVATTGAVHQINPEAARAIARERM